MSRILNDIWLRACAGYFGHPPELWVKQIGRFACLTKFPSKTPRKMVDELSVSAGQELVVLLECQHAPKTGEALVVESVPSRVLC